MLIEIKLKFFIGKVNTKLFKAIFFFKKKKKSENKIKINKNKNKKPIFLKIFKTKNI